MSRQHQKLKVIGTYPDPNDEEKMKTAAWLYYQVPDSDSSPDSQDWMTCVSDKLSQVIISREWAQPKGLLAEGTSEGFLNFKLISFPDPKRENDTKLKLRIGGQGDEHTSFVHSSGLDGDFLQKLHTAKAWHEAKIIGSRAIKEDYRLNLALELHQSEDCKCDRHVKGSENAKELDWIVVGDVDRPVVAPVSVEMY